MAEVYILFSTSLDSFYVGSCKNFDQRFKQHLNGDFEKAFTKKATDWQKFLVIENLSYFEARKIESHIKKMKSRKYIDNLKTYDEMRWNLIDKFRTGSSR